MNQLYLNTSFQEITVTSFKSYYILVRHAQKASSYEKSGLSRS